MANRPTSSGLAISAILLLTAFAGCADFDMDDGSSGGDGADGQGDVAFYVKDAPNDELRSVFVTFTEVKVHRAGGNDLTTVPDNDLQTVEDNDLQTVEDNDLQSVPDDDIDDDPQGGGWFTIVNATHTIDLKQFQGDARAFLGDSTVQEGKYTQIRIIVSDVYGEDLDGNRVNITLSSGTLKIVRPWNVEDGETTSLVVDFDLDKSLTKTGQNGYRLKPVLKLTVENGAPAGAEGSDAVDGSDAATDAPGGKPTDKGKPANNTHKP